MRARCAAAAVALLACGAAPAQENPAARYVTLAAPDCPGPRNIIAEAAPAPANVTHMRVQYMGDPETPELALEIANAVTWDAGTFTGLHAPATAQRGYRDEGPPVAANAYQLSCGAAGFLINTRSFSHRVAIFGAGPSVSVARALDPAPAPFREPNATLLLEANVSVPWVDTPGMSADPADYRIILFGLLGEVFPGTGSDHEVALGASVSDLALSIVPGRPRYRH